MKYILEGKIPKPEPDFDKWQEWFFKTDKILFRDEVREIEVITRFLGIDRSWQHGKVELFETIIFESDDQEIPYLYKVYETWDQAQKGHEDVVMYLLSCNQEAVN